MYTQTLTALTAFLLLIGFSHADEQHTDQASMEEINELNKRAQEGFYMPRASNWISSRPSKSLNPANDDIGYLLQFLEKRSGEFTDELDGGERSIRSPLGTMRFGKRASGPLGTMRFGKRAAPLGTMRFGKRAAPLGTMRFGRR